MLTPRLLVLRKIKTIFKSIKGNSLLVAQKSHFFFTNKKSYYFFL